ncbi:Burp domain protein rd22, partial [Thalictrum thalictroides]
DTIEQLYTVQDRVEKLETSGGITSSSSPSAFVICHGLTDSIHYCHLTDKTHVYKVPLQGKVDGTIIQAMVACHLDTSKWNPLHLSFYQLKVKPGEATICHFLVKKDYVWVPVSTVMI